MNNEINISLLERYLQGEIAREEVLDIEGNPVDDEALQKSIEQFDDIKLGLKVIALRDDLKQIETEFEATQQPKPGWVRYAAAAAILLVAVASYFIFTANQAPRFEDYFTHFENLSISRGSESDQLQEAMKFYQIEDYDKALSLFKALPENQLTGESHFYTGISALATQDFILALEQLSLAEYQSLLEYSQPIRWYKALAHWQRGELDEAKALLAQIKPGHYQSDKAQTLLEELRD